MFRESAHVYEIADGWARVTEPYDASCAGGRSEYVDSGEAACTEANGITNGRFAEWVEVSALSTPRPADSAATAIATADESLVAQSDDLQRHRRAFASAAAQLIADSRCTRQDFLEMGGWMKSVNQYRDQPVYFTYCDGMTNAGSISMRQRAEYSGSKQRSDMRAFVRTSLTSALACVLAACGQQRPQPPQSSPSAIPAEYVPADIVGPNMTVGQWRAASIEARAAYFRGVVSVYITEPAQNAAQRRFDDDLALDLTDCVDAEIEQADGADAESVRPFFERCMQASGIAGPG